MQTTRTRRRPPIRTRNSRRNMNQMRNVQHYPAIAKEYIDDIKLLRIKLREKRDEYNKAKKEKNTVKMNLAEEEFINLSYTWPYFRMIANHVQVDRVQQPYSTNPPLNSKPYPPDGVLMKTTVAERWQMIATALLIRRRLDKRKRLEGLITKISSVDGINDFKIAIEKCVNPTKYEEPPSYHRGDTEEDEYEDEAGFYANPVEQIRYNRLTRPAPTVEPFVRTPEGTGQVTGTGPLPGYEEENYELRGGKTRRRIKRSKHKRSKHKRSKNKRSKNKRSKHRKTRK